jgi:hypothetical protein
MPLIIKLSVFSSQGQGIDCDHANKSNGLAEARRPFLGFRKITHASKRWQTLFRDKLTEAKERNKNPPRVNGLCQYFSTADVVNHCNSR